MYTRIEPFRGLKPRYHQSLYGCFLKVKAKYIFSPVAGASNEPMTRIWISEKLSSFSGASNFFIRLLNAVLPTPYERRPKI